MSIFKTLPEMKIGESGRVAEIQGGAGFIRRLGSLGIRPGKNITKVSAHFWRGPQVIKIDTMQIALGFGMSRKILVEVEKK